jgi:hypothetical protein
MGISVDRLRTAMLDEHYQELAAARENLKWIEDNGGAEKFPGAHKAISEEIKEIVQWIQKWTPMPER